MMRDHAAKMEELHRRHRAGDKRAVLDALFVCLAAEPPRPVPDWARRAFEDAYGKVFGALAGSWDDVFGKPKGRLAQRRTRMLLVTPVWKRCRALHAAGHGIGDKLFGEVADEFGIGARQVKEMFYKAERAYGYRANIFPRAIRRRR
jgi:hypothetical protein